MKYFLILLGWLLFGSSNVSSEPLTDQQRKSLVGPNSTGKPFINLGDSYHFSSHLNPFYLRGDYNGDGKIDVATLIRENEKRRYGIAIFHEGRENPIILGAGFEMGNGGFDFLWIFRI